MPLFGRVNERVYRGSEVQAMQSEMNSSEEPR